MKILCSTVLFKLHYDELKSHPEVLLNPHLTPFLEEWIKLGCMHWTHSDRSPMREKLLLLVGWYYLHIFFQRSTILCQFSLKRWANTSYTPKERGTSTRFVKSDAVWRQLLSETNYFCGLCFVSTKEVLLLKHCIFFCSSCSVFYESYSAGADERGLCLH